MIMMTLLICCHPQTQLEMMHSKQLPHLMKSLFMKKPQLVKIMEAPHNNQQTHFMTHPLKQVMTQKGKDVDGKDALDAD